MLSDPTGVEVEKVKRLRSRSYRQKTGLVIVEGYPEVNRAIKARIPMEVLYVCPEILPPEQNTFEGLPVCLVDKSVFAAMAFGSRLKGVLALCKPNHLKLDDLQSDDNSTFLILDRVEKPGNIGAVLRTADGAGASAVVLSDAKTDLYNQHVVRSSIGTVFTVPVVSCDKEALTSFLTDHSFTIYSTSAHASQEYTQVNLRSKSAIIVGNEHEGVSPYWMERSHGRIYIPMDGAASSLNVTVSASILLYEARRQKSL